MTGIVLAVALCTAATSSPAVETSTDKVAGLPVGDPLKDVALTATVRQVLAADAFLAGVVIDVASAAGIVTLQGRVRDISLREHATRLVQTVFGVTRVDNRLAVTLALG
jgi:osmotically-inducible protein OsmY